MTDHIDRAAHDEEGPHMSVKPLMEVRIEERWHPPKIETIDAAGSTVETRGHFRFEVIDMPKASRTPDTRRPPTCSTRPKERPMAADHIDRAAKGE